jgi:hypothetical protein
MKRSIFNFWLWASLLIACDFEENARDQILKTQNQLQINAQTRIESENVSILSIEEKTGEISKLKIRPSGLDFSIKVFSKSCRPTMLDFELKHYHRNMKQTHVWQYGFNKLTLEQDFLNDLTPVLSFKEKDINDDFYPLFDTREIFIQNDCTESISLDEDCLNLQSKAWRLYLERQPYFAYTYALSEVDSNTTNTANTMRNETQEKVACTQFSTIESVVKHDFQQQDVKRWIVVHNLIDLSVQDRLILFNQIKLLSPDFLILNGDSYSKEIFTQVDDIGLPWFSIIGDRDLKNVTAYLNEIGTNALKIDIDHIRLIFIDTADQEISNTQYDFLEDALRSNQKITNEPPKIKLIFSHIPPMTKHNDDDQFHYRIDATRVLSLCSQYQVNLWFSSQNPRDEYEDLLISNSHFRLIQQGKARQFTLFEKSSICTDTNDWTILANDENQSCVKYQQMTLSQ